MHTQSPPTATTATALAINEVSLWRQSYQAAKIRITVDGKVRLDELICDGVMVATPAGSTAYNLSAHGPILPLDAPLLALTPVSPFRPRRWRGALLSNKSTVRFDILEPEKRPVNAAADHTEVKCGDFGHRARSRRRRRQRCCSTPAIPGTNGSSPNSSAIELSQRRAASNCEHSRLSTGVTIARNPAS